MKLLGVVADEQAIWVGVTFMATLDGKHRFPKHVSMKVFVRNFALFQKVTEEVKIGDEIEVTITLDRSTFTNCLESFRRV